MDQNKKRIFEKEKNEYTFRTLNSLIKSMSVASRQFKKVKFEILVTDTNSPKEDINEDKKYFRSVRYREQIYFR